ncbi:unnamed protein product [Cochlearia groenlandica]
MRPNTLRIFLQGLLDIQHWAWHRTDWTAKLSIGGWVTPILKLMRVPLMGKFEGARFRDIPYLAKEVVIVGELEGRYGYSFKYGGTPRIILLLNEECTSFRYNEALSFQPPSRAHHDPIRQPLEPICGPRNKLQPKSTNGGKGATRRLPEPGSSPPRQRSQRHYIHSPPRPESDNDSPTFSTNEDFDSSCYYY